MKIKRDKPQHLYTTMDSEIGEEEHPIKASGFDKRQTNHQNPSSVSE